MAYAELVSFSFENGSDLVEVTALVDDAVQVLPATSMEPPEFDSGYCVTTLLWDEDITPANAPTQSDIENRIPWIPSEDWYLIPPSELDD